MRLSWDRLLCKKRPHRDGNDTIADGKPQTMVRSAFGQDYSRVVFSTAFRRLSKKTQVHPFANIDFIHNRLTHSLEVASLWQTFGHGGAYGWQRRALAGCGLKRHSKSDEATDIP